MNGRIFVYGTLMRGFSLGGHLRGACFVGRGSTPGRLYDLGPFPGMAAPLSLGDRVHGEVHVLRDPERDLVRLDEVEDRGLFVRRSVRVRLGGGTQVDAWAYVFDGDLSSARQVPEGDYRVRPAGRRR